MRAFSVITNLRMELFQALVRTVACRGPVNCINKRTAGQLAIILKPQCGRRVCVTRATWLSFVTRHIVVTALLQLSIRPLRTSQSTGNMDTVYWLWWPGIDSCPPLHPYTSFVCIVSCWILPSWAPRLCSWRPAARRRGGQQPRHCGHYRLPALLLFADSEKLQRKPSNHEVRDHYTLGTQQHTSLGVSSNCKPWRTHILRFIVSTEIV